MRFSAMIGEAGAILGDGVGIFRAAVVPAR
jgi:hypothetical protein